MVPDRSDDTVTVSGEAVVQAVPDETASTSRSRPYGNGPRKLSRTW